MSTTLYGVAVWVGLRPPVRARSRDAARHGPGPSRSRTAMLPAMPTPSSAALDEAVVEQIVTIDDPLERNAAITRGYHDLSEAVAGLLGRTPRELAHVRPMGERRGATVHRRRGRSGRASARSWATTWLPRSRPATRRSSRTSRRRSSASCVRCGRSRALTRRSRPRSCALRPTRSWPGARTSRAPFGRTRTPSGCGCWARKGRRRSRPASSLPTPRWVRTSSASPTRSCERRSPGAGSPRSPPRCTWGSASPRASWSSRGTCRRPTTWAGRCSRPGWRRSRIQMRSRWRSASARIPTRRRLSDAPDWESYDERMGFIFTLLRAHQCDPALFALPPGTPEAPIVLGASGG